MYKNILVSIQKDLLMDKLLDQAVELANLHQANLYIAHINEYVVNTPSNFDTPQTIVINTFSEVELSMIKEKYSKLIQKDVEILTSNARTVSNTVTHNLATDNNIDLIICGSNKKIHLNERVLGSTASNIVKNSLCDVFIIKDDK